ncbi:two-component sensor histidine kinase [Neptunitalea chrysea]|uniref:histidine kinase n=1 Tax=Neptunitalea chrysea TaxID=1647581 RepID=A0A9W6B3M1_9FLAO|nr:HAMP domain-containing sensor histidine kinase [Neptunitalea chrysea]GLB51879.1 two-component sensor histidine kinase [Neptunitalea chrysea]
MGKKLFVLLVILMSLSLIGIIFVQGYWIKTSVDDKEDQFSMNVSLALTAVTNEIQNQEIKHFVETLINNNIDSIEPTIKSIRQLYLKGIDEKTNQPFIYSNEILEENFGYSPLFENSLDSIQLKRYINVSTITTENEALIDNKRIRSPQDNISKIRRLSDLDKAMYLNAYKDVAKTFPITRRTSKEKIKELLKKELKARNLDLKFEYGIYSDALATKIRSDNFEIANGSQYSAPLFTDNENKIEYDLIVSFPSKKKYLISSIIVMVVLSIAFTLIIIIAYSSALLQLLRQRQISEIKTDFINNMTHEFKTPIATINLALDSVKSPKIMGDTQKLNHYLNVIKEENKRMHAQVENVLRISRLEKNELNISKERLDVHDLITDAITHVLLIVEDRGGYINEHLQAEKTEVLANDVHFTNVLVNILDNAVKYSEGPPQIEVYTEVVNNSVIIKIQDNGIGMNKAVLKKAFEKFYREHTGDIHNVKGHGLGLAYVKKIVDDHQGEVYAESEKGKGSTFYIKLPLI